MIRSNRFIGLTEEEQLMLRIAKKPESKYVKTRLKAVVCRCGMEMFYRAVRCPVCREAL